MKNDYLIKEIINDPIFDGTIWAAKPLSGPASKKKTYPLRRVDCTNGRGYKIIRFNYYFILVHRIIYQKFNGNINPSLEINHKDGNKSNNKPENLELVTSKENTKHAIENGLFIPYETINRKFTDQQAKEIKDLIKNTNLKSKEIAQKYNCCYTVIDKIKRGETYKHV